MSRLETAFVKIRLVKNQLELADVQARLTTFLSEADVTNLSEDRREQVTFRLAASTARVPLALIATSRPLELESLRVHSHAHLNARLLNLYVRERHEYLLYFDLFKGVNWTHTYDISVHSSIKANLTLASFSLTLVDLFRSVCSLNVTLSKQGRVQSWASSRLRSSSYSSSPTYDFCQHVLLTMYAKDSLTAVVYTMLSASPHLSLNNFSHLLLNADVRASSVDLQATLRVANVSVLSHTQRFVVAACESSEGKLPRWIALETSWPFDNDDDFKLKLNATNASLIISCESWSASVSKCPFYLDNASRQLKALNDNQVSLVDSWSMLIRQDEARVFFYIFNWCADTFVLKIDFVSRVKFC